MKNAVGYVRVSTGQQAAEGVGLDVQRAAITATAERVGLHIVAWCEDAGVSGSVEGLERPGFSCVLDHLDNGEASTVLVYSLDRIARELQVQETALALLWSRGADVYVGGELTTADDSSDPMRKLIRQVLGSMFEFEKSNIVRRMHNGRKHLRRTEPDRYVGGHTVPAGCMVETDEHGKRRLVATPELVEMVRTIRNGLASGMTHRAVGLTLEPTLTGQQVKRRLESAERLGL